MIKQSFNQNLLCINLIVDNVTLYFVTTTRMPRRREKNVINDLLITSCRSTIQFKCWAVSEVQHRDALTF
jgi:hypothetical protein